MPEMMRPSLADAVSVDTDKLESVFQGVLTRVDQQGAQIQALADAMRQLAPGHEMASVGQRLDKLEQMLAAKASRAVEERNSDDIGQLKQELAAKADAGLMAEANMHIERLAAGMATLHQKCEAMEREKADTTLGDKLQASDERLNEVPPAAAARGKPAGQAVGALQTMLACKADRSEFNCLYAATERGAAGPACRGLSGGAARHFEKFQQQAEAKLSELDRALEHCSQLLAGRVAGDEMERVCVRVAALERSCVDQGDKLHPGTPHPVGRDERLAGEAVHFRSALAQAATKEELHTAQEQNRGFMDKVDGLLERLWAVQREVSQAAPRGSLEHLIEVVGRKADKTELNAVASKRWCEDLAEMLRGETRAATEDLQHRQGHTSTEMERYKAETIDLRWQVQELQTKSQLMTRFINAF